jgi:hypothetical protein
MSAGVLRAREPMRLGRTRRPTARDLATAKIHVELEGERVPKSLGLNHVGMGVPVGTLTASYRTALLDFYGDLLGWREIKQLRLPDRLTILVGNSASSICANDQRASTPRSTSTSV